MKVWIGLSFFVAVATVSGLWFLPEAWLMRTTHKALLDLSEDPDIGFALHDLKLPLKDAFGRELPQDASRDLLVYGGHCTGCSLNAISFDALPTSDFDRVILFYQAENALIQESFDPKGIPGNVFLVSDEQGSVARSLNGAWTGRWFEFDSGRLVDLQSDSADRRWRGHETQE